MNTILEHQIVLGALLIFSVRVLNIALDTLRMLFVMRNQRLWAWMSGFFVSLIYVLLFASLLSNLNNPAYIIAYAAGYATGSVVGIWIEERMALGFKLIQVISPGNGALIAKRLRDDGFGVTEIPGRGRDGAVTILHVNARRRELPALKKSIRDIDEHAFITQLDVHPIYRGIWKR